MTPPLIQDRFDTYLEAKAFQRAKMDELIKAGYCFRSVELCYEEDCERKKPVWKVWIKIFPEAREELEACINRHGI